jgi:HAD superfamily hydrolase (TIGR01549 family)
MTESILSLEQVLKYRHVFVDVGNVLFHDYIPEMVFNYYLFLKVNKIVGATMDEFFNFKSSCILCGIKDYANNFAKVKCPGHSKRIICDAWQQVLNLWVDLNKPIVNSVETIGKLSSVVPVSILANQPKETVKLLEKHNISKYFRNIFLDSLVGYSKPDRKFYDFVLTAVNLQPNETIMIGDRLDNDIIPSKNLGMSTALIRYKIEQDVVVSYVPKHWQTAYLKNFHILASHYTPLSDVAEETNDMFDYSADSLGQLMML